MQITFTKVFAEGSLLDGLTFTTTIKHAKPADLARLAELAESGDVVRTGHYGGSDYKVADVVADMRGTLPLIEVTELPAESIA